MRSISYTMFDKKRGKEQFPFQTETSVAEHTHKTTLTEHWTEVWDWEERKQLSLTDDTTRRHRDRDRDRGRGTERYVLYTIERDNRKQARDLASVGQTTFAVLTRPPCLLPSPTSSPPRTTGTKWGRPRTTVRIGRTTASLTLTHSLTWLRQRFTTTLTAVSQRFR